MSLHIRHHSYQFLKDKEMNELYVFYGIFNFALELISIFVPIYLYKIGYSIPWIIFHYFITSLVFVAFSYTGARIVSRIGIKHSFLVTVPLFITYFLGLHFIPDFPALFFILPAIRAVKMVLFNFSFHLNFIKHSDRKNRGKEVTVAQASALAASFLAPFFGGAIVKFANFPTLFITGSLILLASVIPLFMSRECYEKTDFNRRNLFRDIFRRENIPYVMSFSGYAIESWIGFIIWPIFLYLIFFNTESVGAATSLTTILTFLIFYYIGKESDKKDKRQLLKVGTVLYFFGWLGRIFVDSFTSILFIDTYKNLSQHFLYIPWSAYFYDLAAKGNYFKFIVQREIIFNVARIAVLPLLMLIFSANFHPFGISFSLAAFSSLFYIALNKKTV